MFQINTFSTQTTSVKGATPWYRRERAALVAMGWFWLLFLALAFIALLTGWASLAFTLGLHWLVSFGAGAVAAWLHQSESPSQPQHVRMGALAGFYLPLTTSFVILVAAVLIGMGSFGVLVPLMIPYFAVLPAELATCSALGAAGAWIYKKIAFRAR